MGDDRYIVIPPRKPGPRVHTGPLKKTSCTVTGRLVAVFAAVCYLEGRKPYQLVADVMRDYLWEKEKDPHVQEAMRAARIERQSLLTVVPDA